MKNAACWPAGCRPATLDSSLVGWLARCFCRILAALFFTRGAAAAAAAAATAAAATAATALRNLALSSPRCVQAHHVAASGLQSESAAAALRGGRRAACREAVRPWIRGFPSELCCFDLVGRQQQATHPKH
jgi:hypothetical protein